MRTTIVGQACACEKLALMQYAPVMAATKPKPLLRWSILIFRSKLQWLGDVEAASEAEAIAKGAEQFKQDAKRLMAVKRG